MILRERKDAMRPHVAGGHTKCAEQCAAPLAHGNFPPGVALLLGELVRTSSTYYGNARRGRRGLPLVVLGYAQAR